MDQQTHPEVIITLGLTEQERPAVKSAAFDALFFEAVDSAFSLLGDSAKQSLLSYMDRRLGAEKGKCSISLEAFADALRDVFGFSAQLIEMRIMQLLHAKVPDFKYTKGNGELSFLDYVEALRAFV